MSESKIALVTGASRGIGAAIAEALAAAGMTIIGTATSEKGADAITARFNEQGITGRGLVMRVDDDASVTEALADITANEGAPAVLVNNAGITRDNLLMRMKQDEWDDVINTNLTSLYRVTKPLLRGMTKARWGRIINVGSVVGSMGNPGQANYSATKAAAAGFARSLACEVGARGITVNTVAPGFIQTDMTDELADSHKEALLAQVPAGRLGSPKEIAATVAFLASDGAAYITGETIQVNGGMYMG